MSDGDLFRLLRKKSYREGEFTLASGKKSDFYIDCKKTFLSSHGMRVTAHRLTQRINDDISYVAGEGVGGAPLAISVCMYAFYALGWVIQPVIVRPLVKDHGTKQRVEYDDTPFIPDFDCLVRDTVLVEDVLTTGTSALNAVQALRDAKFNVRAVVAIVDRLEGARELFMKELGSEVEVISIFDRNDFVGDL